MDRLFIGKFKHGDQLEKNYYRHDGLNISVRDSHFSGLQDGDFVLPVQNGTVSKLFRLIGFESINNDTGTEAKFEAVKTFPTPITLSNVCLCKYLQPDIILMNKAVKSTKGIGFHQLQLETTCPPIIDIDFNKDKRRYFVCTKKKLEDVSFFKPSDICIVISDTLTESIENIVEFNGQEFNRHSAFWSLFQEKITEIGKQYTLKELYEFANPKQDDAKMKENYLMSTE